MKKKIIATLSIFLINSLSSANEYTSMQGYSGFINIPTPKTLKYGTVEFAFSNQLSLSKKITPKNRFLYKNAEDYLVNVGFLPFLEISGRISNIPKAMRDLSFSAKLSLPTKKISAYLPNLAVGVQDTGGALAYYSSKYVVMGDRYKNLSYSLGYGFDSKRLDGVFYGINYDFSPYISTLA